MVGVVGKAKRDYIIAGEGCVWVGLLLDMASTMHLPRYVLRFFLSSSIALFIAGLDIFTI